MESGARRSPSQTSETCDRGATEAVSDLVLSLSDKELQKKIERLTSFLSSNGVSYLLPDKGKKIWVHLQQLKEEQECRRQHPVRVVDEGCGNCEQVSLSTCAESSGSLSKEVQEATKEWLPMDMEAIPLQVMRPEEMLMVEWVTTEED